MTKGFCKYCGKEYTRAGMLKHLSTCVERKKVSGAEKESGYFELVITAKYDKDYWLIVEMKDTASFRELDQFIRDIWVECCGHLSAFYINGETYKALPDSDSFWGGTSHSMDISLKNLLTEGMRFTYRYDFGSTTELEVNVQSYCYGEKKEENITILSRNHPPVILCSICGEKSAQWVNPEGFFGGIPFLCDECLERLEEDPEECWEEICGEMLLPVCNSPRMGVCGYCGSERYPDQFEPDQTEGGKRV